jgi:hypothetical protein
MQGTKGQPETGGKITYFYYSINNKSNFILFYLRYPKTRKNQRQVKIN